MSLRVLVVWPASIVLLASSMVGCAHLPCQPYYEDLWSFYCIESQPRAIYVRDRFTALIARRGMLRRCGRTSCTECAGVRVSCATTPRSGGQRGDGVEMRGDFNPAPIHAGDELRRVPQPTPPVVEEEPAPIGDFVKPAPVLVAPEPAPVVVEPEEEPRITDVEQTPRDEQSPTNIIRPDDESAPQTTPALPKNVIPEDLGF